MMQPEHEGLWDRLAEHIVYHDLQMCVRWANQAACNSIGLTREDVVGRHCYELWEGTDMPCPECPVARAMASGRPAQGERTSQDGRTWSIHGYPIADGDGAVSGCIEVTLDVTDMRRAGEQASLQERLSANVIESLPGSFYVFDREGRLVHWNENFRRIGGHPSGQLRGMRAVDFVADEEKERVAGLLADAWTTGYIEFEAVAQTKAGRRIPFYLTGRRVTIDGKDYLIGTGFDITRRREAERQVEAERNLLRSVIDSLPDLIYVKDRQGRFVVCNSEIRRRVDVTGAEAVIGKTDFDLYPEDVAREFFAREQELMRTGRPILNEEFRTTDRLTGQPLATLVSKTPLMDAEGDVVGLVGTCRNITELRQTQEAYRTLVDQSLQGRVIIQDMHVVFANQAMAEITGYSVEEMLTCTSEQLHDFIHPEDRPLVWGYHQARLGGQSLPERYTFRAIRKDGAVRWLEISTSRIEYKGRPAIQAGYVDVTERVEAEVSLRRSEARNRALLDAMPDLIFRLDEEGTFLDCNVGERTRLFAPPDESVGRTVREVMPSAVADAAMNALARTLREGCPQTFEYQLDMADEGLRDYECRLAGCGEGEVLAVVRDITDRKRADSLSAMTRDLALRLNGVDELREGARLCLEAAMRASDMDCGGVYLFDRTSDRMDLLVHAGISAGYAGAVSCLPINSPYGRAILKAECFYSTAADLGIPVGPAQRREGLRAAAVLPIRDGRVTVGGLVLASHTLEEVPHGARMALETIVAQVGGTFSRLKAQEALRQAEREKATILDTMSDIVTYQDRDHRIVWANRAAARTVEMTPAEMVGRRCYQLWYGRSRPCAGCPVHEALVTGESAEAETAYHGDGTWFLRAEPVKDARGRVVGVVELATDITERKLAEQRLQDFQDTVNRSPAMVFLWRVAPGAWPVEFASANVERVLGYTAEEFMSGRVSWPGITHPEDDARLEAEVAEHLRQGHAEWSQEYRLTTKAGQVRWFRDQNLVLTDDGGRTTHIQSIVLDITETRRAEEALRYRVEFEAAVADISHDFVGLSVDAIDQGISRALEKVGRFCHADRSFVHLLHDDGARMSEAYEWCAEGIASRRAQMQSVSLETLPSGMEELTRVGVLKLPRVAALEGARAEARPVLEAGGVKSLLSVPIVIGDDVFGFFGVVTVEQERCWSDDEVALLQIVAGVFANALERKRSADALKEKLAFETLLAELSATFVDTAASDIDGQIQRWLARVGEFLDLDRGTVVRMRGDDADIDVTHAWAATGLRRAPDRLPRESFGWFVRRLKAGQIIAFSTLSDAPAEATGERDYALREGLKSVLVVPVTAGDEVLGAVIFASMRTERVWSGELIQRLRLVGEVFAHALVHQQAQEALHASEQKFRGLVEASSDWIWEVDADGVYTYASPKVEELLGYTPEEVVGKTPFDLMSPHEARRTAEQFNLYRERASSFEGLISVNLHRNGREVLLETSGVPILDSRGTLLGYRGVDRDVTERQRMEDALRESEERFRGIFENAVLGLYRTTPDGRILMANQSLVAMLGYDSFEQLAQINVEDEGYVPGYDRTEFKTRIETEGQILGYECAWPRRDGTTLFVRESARAVRDERGNTLCYEGTVENVTLRKQAEDALRRSEATLKGIFDSSPNAIVLLAPEGTILECNPRALEMYGASSRDQLIGIDAFSVLVPDDVGLGRRLIEQALREGIARGAELTVRRRDGSEFVGQFAMGAIPDGSGKPAQIVAIVDDVTDRRRMEDALRASERNYREIFNATNEAIFVHDAKTGKVLDVNQSMLAMYGCDYDGALRCDVSDLSLGMPPYSAAEAREWIDRAAREGPQLFEWLCRRSDGQAFWAEVNLKGAMIGGQRRILAVVRDISDRKQAETEAQQHLAELTRAWHANTMGEMASGLAHELNQPLCAIVNYTNGCLRMTKRPGASVELLRSPMKQVAEQAERAANIIKHIRGLVARRGRDRSPLDLNEVLLSALDMVRLEADRQGVTIDTQLATDLPPIPADAVEIEQVAMNLMRNAIEAMSVPEATNRILTLGTSQRKDGQIAIWVSDTGPGFPSDLAEKLFNSFYTTKRDGLGIGLSLSRRIIEAYGGRLWAESDGRTGATFRCILPV